MRNTILGGAAAAALVLGLVLWVADRGRIEAHAPVKVDRAEADSIVRDIEQDRARAETWLRSAPDSYLAAVARQDFGANEILTVGRAADNDVSLDASGIEPHHLKVTLEGDGFRVEAVDPAARFKIKDETKREASVGPSGLGLGRFTLRLSHQRFPALIVFDPESPRLREYKGFEYFPVDLSYRYDLPLTPNPDPETVTIMSTRGHQRRARRAGWFDFVANRTACRLEATRLLEPGVGEDDLIILFRDATSGKETYALGRYVDAKKLPSGNYLLDFNTAYNPACAFSDFYNCPVPPAGNTLKVPIRAGEMDSHYH